MDNTHGIYNKISLLEHSAMPNESKANELRKLFEEFLFLILKINLSEEHINLHELINRFCHEENRQDLHYVCHRLRKDLNTWSHHNDATLVEADLSDYFIRFRNIVQSISGENDTEKTTSIKSFSLDMLDLNAKQHEAVLSKAKISLVNAGPGTGKTYLIVGRILQEVSAYHDKKIFGLSFTNVAADELQHKIDNIIYRTSLARYRGNIATGTIHSFALNLIQQYYEYREQVFDFVVIDETELKDIKDEHGNNKVEVAKYLKDNKILTFDRIIALFTSTMKKNETFRIFIAKQLDEVIIDEAQDLDKSQYEILSLLFQHNKNLKLFFVGDQRQNLYAFKGGSLNNILEYFKNEKDVIVVDLEHSYRCPQSILEFVNTFKFSDCSNIALNNALGIAGKKLDVGTFEDKEEESNFIAKKIISKISSGISLNDIAIIYTTTFYFKEILETLNAYEIPFKVFGGQYIIDPHIRLFRLIINYIYSKNKYAFKSIQHFFINEELGENLEEALVSLSDMDMSSKEDHKNLRIILNFIKKMENGSKSPLDIVTSFSNVIEKENIFGTNENILEKYHNLKTIIENDLTLDDYDKLKLNFSPNHPKLGQFYSRSDEIVLSDFYAEGEDFVTVTTVHSAKGLEWDSVFIPGMVQDSFPRYFNSAMCMSACMKNKEIWETNDCENKCSLKQKEELSNERKKFYVACTRSKNELILTRPKEITFKSKKDGKFYTFDKHISEFVAQLSQKNGNIL